MTPLPEAIDRDTLLEAARALREERRLPEALAVLSRLEALHPRFSRQFEERGHCHVVRGDASGAVAALQEAVRLNPALPSSWDMLAQLHRRRGDASAAAAAAARVAMLDRLPRALVVANSLLADGDLETAELVILAYLRHDTGSIGALRLLARIRLERGAPTDAEEILEHILQQAPDYHPARADLGALRLEQQQPGRARVEAERLLAAHPDDREYLKQHAAACVAADDPSSAIDDYARLLAAGSETPTETFELRLWRANALKTAGRPAEAIADYRAAIAARPDQAVAWFALANLKTIRFSDEDIARMRAALAQAGPVMDQIYLHFALGKAEEDRADYATSWRHYEQGNALRGRGCRYRSLAMTAATERLRTVFTRDFFAARIGWGVEDPAPIFVVGLPRSGSTLVEQILASHPEVEGTHELTELDRLARAVCGVDPECGLPLDPAVVAQLDRAEVRSLGESFLAATRHYRRLGRAYFVDKMPNDFWHVGLIHLLLPAARIIDVRRSPLACCFGNWKQLFGTDNQEFSYGLADLGRHYRAYLDLMRHWQAVLPGRVLRLHHEDLVDDLDGEVRRLLDHCGLPFDTASLRFHETRRDVRTPSAEQVRQPLTREGLTQWRHYEGWLGPLREALGDAITSYRT